MTEENDSFVVIEHEVTRARGVVVTSKVVEVVVSKEAKSRLVV